MNGPGRVVGWEGRLRLAYGGLHPDRTRDLVQRYGDAGRVVARIGSGAVDVPSRVREAVAVPADVRLGELAALGFWACFRGGEGYPQVLGGYPDAPDVLFGRGGWPSLPGVAVVGTRRCTTYGRRVAEGYGQAIAAAGWTLISGLARGVDGAAHTATVAAGGAGVAVLGCGLDVAYPPEHRELAGRLVAGGGAVVSEYPTGTPPEGWRFPPRNRIISGLAGAVVVVEAGVKGGALITAGTALAQGVAVFAVPGDVDREVSRGCNLLIRDGAHPVLDPADLIEEIALVMGPPPVEASGRVAESGGAAGPRSPIVAVLVAHGPQTLDDLAARTEMPVPRLLAELIQLETDGTISTDGAVYSSRT